MTTQLEELILKYPNKYWDWEYLSSNPLISMKFINEHLEFD